MEKGMAVRLLASVFVLCVSMQTAKAKHPQQWSRARATFYGDSNGISNMGGACGYGDVMQAGYGRYTAAVSIMLFGTGGGCGRCFEVECDMDRVQDRSWCKAGRRITITATNLCPPEPSKPSDYGGWCNIPNHHFDMAVPSFLEIAEYRAGVVPVKYRSVRCSKSGGIRFTIRGNPYFELVLISNVGGPGRLDRVWIKGSQTPDWVPMQRNFGANWQCGTKLTGQSLSFRLTAGSETLILENVTPSNWEFGKTYQSYRQFS